MDLLEESFENIINNLHEGLYLVNSERVITYWNRAAEEITGFAAQELLGKSCRANILTHVNEQGVNLCLGLCPLALSMRDGKQRELEVYLHHKEGHRVPVHVRVNPLYDAAGTINGAAELFTDISSMEATEIKIRELERLAMLDNLTQLANRHYIERELLSRFQDLQRNSVSFGVILFDIDHFKRFNDDYGHVMGDQVLQYVANTLLYNARPFDTFGRWGGEEFIGIIRNVDQERLLAAAERLRILVAESYVMQGKEKLQVTVSVGATMAQEGDNSGSIIDRADRFLYKSKESGRNMVSAG